MPQSQVSEAINVINLVYLVLTFLLGILSTLFFAILRSIKKNVDSIRKRSEENRNEITKIKATLDID